MKGILLAGGTGSRLYPLTNVTNKHLLPVGKYPMIFFPLVKLREAGIKDIFIVTGKDHIGEIGKLLGSGKTFGVSLSYLVQDRPGGIAEAVALSEPFIHSKERIVVALGDNLFSDSLTGYIKNYERQKSGAKILLHKVEDPGRYGVAELRNDKVIRIVEKPKHPKSPNAVTGIYMYDHSVFDMIKRIRPSPRGEWEISDVNNMYISQNLMTYDYLKGWWLDTGTFASYQKANQLLQNATLNI